MSLLSVGKIKKTYLYHKGLFLKMYSDTDFQHSLPHNKHLRQCLHIQAVTAYRNNFHSLENSVRYTLAGVGVGADAHCHCHMLIPHSTALRHLTLREAQEEISSCASRNDHFP